MSALLAPLPDRPAEVVRRHVQAYLELGDSFPLVQAAMQPVLDETFQTAQHRRFDDDKRHTSMGDLT